MAQESTLPPPRQAPTMPPTPGGVGATVGPALTPSVGPGPAQPDWAAQTADTIVRVVDEVRVKTSTPIIKATRAVVFGLLAAIVALMLLVLFCVLWIRVLDIVLPRDVWAAYLVTGLLLCTVGAFTWSKAKRRAA